MHDQQQALLLIEKSLQGFLRPSRLPDSPFAISLICMILSLLYLLSSKSQRVGWCCLLLRFSFSSSSRILSSLLSICFFFSNSCLVLSFLTRCPQNSRCPSNQAKLNTRLQTSHSSFSSSSLSQSGSFRLASFHWEEASPSQPEWSGVGFMIRYEEFLVYFLAYSADDQSSSICLFWFCWPNCEDLRRVSSIYWFFSSSLSSTSWICLCSFKIYSYFFSTFLLRSKHASSRLPTHRFLSSSLALSSLPILLRLPICRSFSLMILFSFLTSSWYLLRESLSWYLFQQEKSLTSSPITNGLGLLSLVYDFSVGRGSPLLVMALERVSLILVRLAMRCFSQIIQMLATSFLLSRLLRSFSHCDCFLLISLRTLSNSSCRPSIFSVLALGSLARGLAGWFMINCQLQIKMDRQRKWGAGDQLIRNSIKAIIPACHAGDPSSILGCGGFFIISHTRSMVETAHDLGHPGVIQALMIEERLALHPHPSVCLQGLQQYFCIHRRVAAHAHQHAREEAGLSGRVYQVVVLLQGVHVGRQRVAIDLGQDGIHPIISDPLRPVLQVLVLGPGEHRGGHVDLQLGELGPNSQGQSLHEIIQYVASPLHPPFILNIEGRRFPTMVQPVGLYCGQVVAGQTGHGRQPVVALDAIDLVTGPQGEHDVKHELLDLGQEPIHPLEVVLGCNGPTLISGRPGRVGPEDGSPGVVIIRGGESILKPVVAQISPLYLTPSYIAHSMCQLVIDKNDNQRMIIQGRILWRGSRAAAG